MIKKTERVILREKGVPLCIFCAIKPVCLAFYYDTSSIKYNGISSG